MSNIKWKTNSQHSNKTSRADAVFQQMISDMGADEEFQRRYVCAHWQDIFDAHIAKHVKVITLEHKKLFLHCDEPSWADTINWQKLTFMGKINKFAGCDLVHDIVFTGMSKSRYKTMPTEYQREIARAEQEYSRRFQQTNVSNEALQAIRERSKVVEDDKLRGALEQWQVNTKKLENLRHEDGWHKCPVCHKLTDPEMELCFACRTADKEKREQIIRKILQDEPWAAYKDILPRVKCTPYMINKQRAFLMQKLFPLIDMEKQDSMEVNQLVMLYKIIPPEELMKHPEYVEETLKHFRYDLGDKYFEYLEKHPEKLASSKRKAKEEEYKAKKEYKPKRAYVPKKKYEIPEYTPGQQREALKKRK